MELFLLLLVPFLIAFGSFCISVYRNDQDYQITLKEFLALISVISVVITGGYLLSRLTSTSDEELWNGRVSDKKKVYVSCSHSYPCNPYPCGDSKHPMTCWHTCYEHSNDWDWNLYTSNGEEMSIDRIDSQGCQEPPRFTKANVGDPTARVHEYTNYIKGNPWSILRREGLQETYKNFLPSYPVKIYDYHYVDRFIVQNTVVPATEIAAWNNDLMNLNADLGKKKKVNVVFVITGLKDSKYLQALEESWLGGKQNDLVIIVSSSEYPKINWVRVMSWSHSEELKINIRDQIQDLDCLRKRTEIISAIKSLIDEKFVKTKMSEFKYLMAGVRPPTWALIVLWIIGVFGSIGLIWFFWTEDVFDEHPRW